MALQVDRAHKKVHNEDPNHPSRKELDFMAPYFFGTEDRANFLLVTTLIGNIITTHTLEYYNIRTSCTHFHSPSHSYFL
jgi:hypothetical protein